MISDIEPLRNVVFNQSKVIFNILAGENGLFNVVHCPSQTMVVCTYDEILEAMSVLMFSYYEKTKKF